MEGKAVRPLLRAIVLFVGICWVFASAQEASTSAGYPRGQLLVTAEWLESHMDDEGLVIVDVRTDEHFDDKVLPGAIRMPWSVFRYNRVAENTASAFVGFERAQELLGQHGITREDTLILYDSVERDGGATASYVFWVLDALGHESKRILERGVDAWIEAGFETTDTPEKLEAQLYQTPMGEVQPRRLVDGDFISKRLADPHYLILDVRSSEEYLGEKGSKDVRGKPLKLGHIPTAVQIDYRQAWVNEKTKALKSYAELQEVYRGVSPSRSIIVYCNSGRRSSFTYFVLRLMGFEDVLEYEASWQEWGVPENFFPVETAPNKLADDRLPDPTARVLPTSGGSRSAGTVDRSRQGGASGGEPAGGYVSCGG